MSLKLNEIFSIDVVANYNKNHDGQQQKPESISSDAEHLVYE